MEYDQGDLSHQLLPLRSIDMKLFREIVFGVISLTLIASYGSATLKAQNESKAEIRIRGKLVRQDKQPVKNASMKVVMTCNQFRKEVEPKIEGNSFEVWLPLGVVDCYYLQISAAAAGVSAETGVYGSQLRQFAIDGFEIQLKPVRTVNALVTFNGTPVPDATVRAIVTLGGQRLAQTDENGIASFDIPEDASLGNLTAWREKGEQRLLGGFGFYRNSSLDPKGAQQRIEVLPCETRKIFVVDENERPVPQLPFEISVVLREPNVTYLNLPDTVNLQTDDNGEVTFDWLPKVSEVSINLTSLERKQIRSWRICDSTIR